MENHSFILDIPIITKFCSKQYRTKEKKQGMAKTLIIIYKYEHFSPGEKKN
jgi:hypothetical protein